MRTSLNTILASIQFVLPFLDAPKGLYVSVLKSWFQFAHVVFERICVLPVILLNQVHKFWMCCPRCNESKRSLPALPSIYVNENNDGVMIRLNSRYDLSKPLMIFQPPLDIAQSSVKLFEDSIPRVSLRVLRNSLIIVIKWA